MKALVNVYARHPNLLRIGWLVLVVVLAACNNNAGSSSGGGGGVPGY